MWHVFSHASFQEASGRLNKETGKTDNYKGRVHLRATPLIG